MAVFKNKGILLFLIAVGGVIFESKDYEFRSGERHQ